jgi:hypothetical protein
MRHAYQRGFPNNLLSGARLERTDHRFEFFLIDQARVAPTGTGSRLPRCEDIVHADMDELRRDDGH